MYLARRCSQKKQSQKLLKLCLSHCSSSKNLIYASSSKLAEVHLQQGFDLTTDFITEKEEETILHEINHKLMRRKYNAGHWDGAIVSYREMEKMDWNPANSTIMKRFEKHVFKSEEECLSATHVLDLHEDGYIKPHIDSIKFCGATVSGLSLLSDAVMRFKLDEKNYSDVLIPRFSVYTMSNDIRYKYTHEILPNIASISGRDVKRTRRITVMKRSNESCHNPIYSE